MSTQINQIIEVRINGEWKYVPVAAQVTEQTDCLVKYGSVRDLFAYHWHGAENYMNAGVPEDISKAAREAMIYQSEDYIHSGACWISWPQYEALTEALREKFLVTIEKLGNAKLESKLNQRLKSLEDMVSKLTQTKLEKETEEEYEEEEYIREELEDAMWAWCCAEKNMGEIDAHVDYFTSGEYSPNDIRVIMYVS